jgi:hypothetical protein
MSVTLDLVNSAFFKDMLIWQHVDNVHMLLFFSDWISFFIAIFHLSHRGDFTACLYVVSLMMSSIEIAAYTYETCVHQTHQQLSDCKGCSVMQLLRLKGSMNLLLRLKVQWTSSSESDNLSRTCRSELMSSNWHVSVKEEDALSETKKTKNACWQNLITVIARIKAAV